MECKRDMWRLCPGSTIVSPDHVQIAANVPEEILERVFKGQNKKRKRYSCFISMSLTHKRDIGFEASEIPFAQAKVWLFAPDARLEEVHAVFVSLSNGLCERVILRIEKLA